MDRLIIDEKTNTLIECRRHVMWEKIDYLIIPHYHNGIRIDRIASGCFEYVSINLLCIEEGVKYLDDSAFENVSVFTVKLPKGIKIGKRCFANSTLTEILLPRDLQIIKKETFLNCRNLETVSAEFGVNTISENAFKGCQNLKEAHFRIVKSIKNGAFEGCFSLKILELGYQIRQLGDNLFKDCHSLESLELEGTCDKLNTQTFSGADGLQSILLRTSAESLYFPPDGFQDTCLKEISLSGNFEPIVKKRCCFPENIILRTSHHSKSHLALGYYFDIYPI